MPIECEWLDRFEASGFVDTFRFINPDQKDVYSWWDMKTGARARNIGWRIDYFYVSEVLKKNIIDAFILPEVMGSDHCPVGIKIEI